jgi:tRNA nucleotidyltransferase (CCA-adding enzyme)
MAASIWPSSWGHLFDPFDGRGDLRRGLIKVLHSGSFRDDATRILRAIRYAQRLGFRLEQATEGLLRDDVSRGPEGISYLDAIKGDRVRHELERIFGEGRAPDMLRMARDLGVLSAIHRSLALDDGVLAELGQSPMAALAEKPLLLLALLTYGAPAVDRPEIIARLAMDARWAKVVWDAGALREAIPRLSGVGLRPSQVYERLRRYDAAAIAACALAAKERVVAQRLQLHLTQLRHARTALNGDDLISMGVPPGPMVGRLLSELLAARLDGEVATREDEEKHVSRRLRA